MDAGGRITMPAYRGGLLNGRWNVTRNTASTTNKISPDFIDLPGQGWAAMIQHYFAIKPMIRLGTVM